MGRELWSLTGTWVVQWYLLASPFCCNWTLVFYECVEACIEALVLAKEGGYTSQILKEHLTQRGPHVHPDTLQLSCRQGN